MINQMLIFNAADDQSREKSKEFVSLIDTVSDRRLTLVVNVHVLWRSGLGEIV